MIFRCLNGHEFSIDVKDPPPSANCPRCGMIGGPEDDVPTMPADTTAIGLRGGSRGGAMKPVNRTLTRDNF